MPVAFFVAANEVSNVKTVKTLVRQPNMTRAPLTKLASGGGGHRRRLVQGSKLL